MLIKISSQKCTSIQQQAELLNIGWQIIVNLTQHATKSKIRIHNGKANGTL